MKTISFEEYNIICSNLIEKVNTFLNSMVNGKQPDSLYNPCAYIMKSPGKRLRPLLVLFSAKAVGGKFKSVLKASAAVELLHNFTLVHDDIMDNADMRRGRETVHKKYDINTAILTGDNLIAIAFLALLKDCRDNDKEILTIFTRGVIEVCEGQSLDKDFEIREKVTSSDYLTMITKKTAALMQMCCSIGARLGGGSTKQIKILENYGRNLGIAFQIQDDLLDINADEAELGKIIGGDLVEGKKTYLLIKALEKAKGDDLLSLQKLIHDKGIKREDIQKFKEIYCRLGVIDDAGKEIEKYTELALKNLQKINSEQGTRLLQILGESLIKRNR